ncbi:MAG TPA: EAL domain-containing protein [Methylomirabilota bacterium]|nr:EAL domain-containing protein [Methylomirabilota bacterium]
MRVLWTRARSVRPDATGETRRPDGGATGPRFDLSGLALVVALCVTGLTAGAGFLLVQQTAAHRRALLLMAQVEERIGQEHVLKRQAILDPRRGAELSARLREVRQQLNVDLDTLERDERRVGEFDRFLRVGGGPKASGRVRAAVQVQQAAVDEAFALLLAGRLDQARAVAPRAGLEEVSQATGVAAGVFSGALERTHRTLAMSVAIFAGLGGVAVGWLGFRALRVGRAYRRLANDEQGLRASEERFRALVQHAADIILVMEPDGTVRHVSPAVQTVLGYEPDRLVGTRGWTLVHEGDGQSAQAFHAELLDHRGGSRSVELRWQHRDGSWRWLEVKGTNLLHQAGVRGIVLNARDISRHKSLEGQLVQRALHDQLTGLPNRMLFMDRLEQALERSARRGKFAAVLFLDLDRFKLVNDNLGHDHGDQLLVQVAERLRGCLRRVDTIARIGGDEFTVLLEEVGAAADAALVAERIIEAFRASFRIETQEIFVGASIGIALGGKDQGTTAQGLLRNADIAMYRAKANGRACFEVFKSSMRETVKGRLKMETELRRALDRGELRLHYQPQVDLRTARIVGLEALVRWEHPERGLVPPGSFIPIAEETGLILPIGRWVLQTACRQASIWRADTEIGLDIVMAVNLSPRQFRHPRLVQDVGEVLAESGLDASGLEVEITEGTAMGDADATVKTLEHLKAIGIRLAIDDFGTGYSSLGYLKRFPIDVLKVDRSFVAGLPANRGDAAIVRAVVGLTRALGLKAVAEGVETADQLTELRELGCDQGQGYFFGRPTATEVADVMLRRSTLVEAVPA